jgi:hypothetical protein
MSSGDTLCIFVPYQNEPPSSNYATLGLRNLHPVLQFDDTTAESAIFTALMPQNYSNSIGVTVYVTGAAVAITGTMGWTVEFERMDSAMDVDSDGFASAQTITATTVPGTAGQALVLNVAVTKGPNMDSIVAGDMFRIRIKRDVANDTATGDVHLLGIEVRET